MLDSAALYVTLRHVGPTAVVESAKLGLRHVETRRARRVRIADPLARLAPTPLPLQPLQHSKQSCIWEIRLYTDLAKANTHAWFRASGFAEGC